MSNRSSGSRAVRCVPSRASRARAHARSAPLPGRRRARRRRVRGPRGGARRGPPRSRRRGTRPRHEPHRTALLGPPRAERRQVVARIAREHEAVIALDDLHDVASRDEIAQQVAERVLVGRKRPAQPHAPILPRAGWCGRPYARRHRAGLRLGRGSARDALPRNEGLVRAGVRRRRRPRRSSPGPRSRRAGTCSCRRRPARARRSPRSSSAIDRLNATPGEGLRLLYVSPLKALNYDIERNLRGPLAGLALGARGRRPHRRHAAARAPARCCARRPTC